MPGAEPFVSFVVLSWNRREDLRLTLQQLQHQHYPSCEVIVVDNGSTDGSAEMVRHSYPWARLITLPHNVGIEGLNVGLKVSRGDIAVLLDDDSYPRPDALFRLVDAFHRYPDLGIAACRIVGTSGHEGGAMGPWRTAASGNEVPIFIGCGAGIRRSVLREIGPFDGAFFLYGNELDLAARVIDAGYTVRYFPEVEFIHARSATNRASLRPESYGIRNLVWIIWKYFPAGQAVLLSLRIALQSVGYRLLKGEFARAWAVLRGVATVPVLLPRSGSGRRVLSRSARQQLLSYINVWFPPIRTVWHRGR